MSSGKLDSRVESLPPEVDPNKLLEHFVIGRANLCLGKDDPRTPPWPLERPTRRKQARMVSASGRSADTPLERPPQHLENGL